MAEQELMRFAANDQFLRRVRFHSHFNANRLTRWQAFNDKDPKMSWTWRDEALQSAKGIDEYHRYWSDRIGENLPAILWFSFQGLTREIEPPLTPAHDPASDDLRYGHLHCSSDAPRDKPHMQLLAKLVNDGVHAGIARICPKTSA